MNRNGPGVIMAEQKEEVESRYPPDMELSFEMLVGMRRFLELLKQGFTPDQADRLVLIVDVAHTTENLLERGWPHSLIVEELT